MPAVIGGLEDAGWELFGGRGDGGKRRMEFEKEMEERCEEVSLFDSRRVSSRSRLTDLFIISLYSSSPSTLTPEPSRITSPPLQPSILSNPSSEPLSDSSNASCRSLEFRISLRFVNCSLSPLVFFCECS